MKNFIYLTLSLYLLNACSTGIVKKDRLDQVKRVAIIGLDLEQQKSVSGVDLVSIALKQSSANQSVAGVRVESLHVKAVYEDIAEKVSKKTGWKVVGFDNMKANATYNKYFKAKTEGFQLRPMINERFVLYAAPGVLDAFAIQSLKTEDLQALAKALKVDALIVATSVVNLNNSSIFSSLVGKGEFHPSSATNFYVYDGTNGEKIFFKRAEGPEIKEGERNIVGMASESHLDEMARQATDLSVDILVKEL